MLISSVPYDVVFIRFSRSDPVESVCVDELVEVDCVDFFGDSPQTRRLLVNSDTGSYVSLLAGSRQSPASRCEETGVSRQYLTECVWRKSCCEAVKMSKVQMLRAFVKQRLTAAAEEKFELFERTIAEYEEELCRQRKLLDAVFKPEVRLHKADVQLLSASQEEDPPEQREWSPSLDQEDPTELPHVKEEQEELWTSQEGQQLPGPEEAAITKSTFPPVPVKSEEEDEEKPQCSQLHQRHTEDMKTEADGEDCGGPEAARSSDPDRHLEPDTDDETSQSSEPETDDSCDWEETREPRSGLNLLQNNDDHSGVQTGEKLFSCSVCGKSYQRKNSLRNHMELHSEGKRLSCSVCKKTFQFRRNFTRHMSIHTGEKPFSCSVCGLTFRQKDNLKQHSTVHTGEKPFTCSVCGKGFPQQRSLRRHATVHTGEKPFSCSVCKASFRVRSSLSIHMRVHTGEKPFSCSVCGKSFALKKRLQRHVTVHTGEKPFSCSVCDRRFSALAHAKRHKCAGESSGNK
ncbi:zinc finger protein 2-like isoform X1 [Chaetodon trifascialis]|uniref:zinc finger protein 2-like isoform X1 n=1 Tax=Chaetodon trifascialis TaxID=109706 RepID=UPI0039969FBE